MKLKDYVNARLIYLLACKTRLDPVKPLDLAAPTFETIETEAHRQSIRGQISFYKALETIMEASNYGEIQITSLYPTGFERTFPKQSDHKT